MINLFRSVRRAFLSANSSSESRQTDKLSKPKIASERYFIYILGEIVLVVLGILIALQINNWDIERIERKTEQNILQDLKVEFEENLKDANRVFKGNNDIYDAMSIIQHKSKDKSLSITEMDSLMYFVFDWFDYTPKPGASNNLINSGNLNLIQNRELRKLLTLWSGVNDELDDDEQLALNYSQNTIIPFLAENYPISNLESYDSTIAFYKRQNQNKAIFESTIHYDLKSLLNNPIFQSHISVKKIYARHNAMECINVMESCESILDLIEIELNKT